MEHVENTPWQASYSSKTCQDTTGLVSWRRRCSTSIVRPVFWKFSAPLKRMLSFNVSCSSPIATLAAALQKETCGCCVTSACVVGTGDISKWQVRTVIPTVTPLQRNLLNIIYLMATRVYEQGKQRRAPAGHASWPAPWLMARFACLPPAIARARWTAWPCDIIVAFANRAIQLHSGADQ